MTKFIQTTQHAIIGESGVAAATLGPGDRVPFNEEAASHKEIARGIEAGDEAYAHLSIEDVDLDDEAKRQEEINKQLEKVGKIVAKEEVKEAKEQAKEQAKEDKAREKVSPAPLHADADPPPQDVEAQKLAEDAAAAESKPRTRKARG